MVLSNINKAYSFYSKHIYDEEKMKLLEENRLPIAGSVPSVLWELFGALLTGRTGAGATGADLQGWEVKSSKHLGSYEYQYHINTGLDKLREDCIVNHLFFSYSETYKDVAVRVMRGSDLASRYFQKWEPDYISNYNPDIPANQRRQRFRKSIPYGYVQEHGTLVMKIESGVLITDSDSEQSRD